MASTLENLVRQTNNQNDNPFVANGPTSEARASLGDFFNKARDLGDPKLENDIRSLANGLLERDSAINKSIDIFDRFGGFLGDLAQKRGDLYGQLGEDTIGRLSDGYDTFLKQYGPDGEFNRKVNDFYNGYTQRQIQRQANERLASSALAQKYGLSDNARQQASAESALIGDQQILQGFQDQTNKLDELARLYQTINDRYNQQIQQVGKDYIINPFEAGAKDQQDLNSALLSLVTNDAQQRDAISRQRGETTFNTNEQIRLNSALQGLNNNGDGINTTSLPDREKILQVLSSGDQNKIAEMIYLMSDNDVKNVFGVDTKREVFDKIKSLAPTTTGDAGFNLPDSTIGSGSVGTGTLGYGGISPQRRLNPKSLSAAISTPTRTSNSLEQTLINAFPMLNPNGISGDLLGKTGSGLVTNGPGNIRSPRAQGLDVDGAIGDPIPAPITGRVIFVGNKGDFGNVVQIQDSDGKIHQLSHLSEFNVKKGDVVTRGTTVAKMGNSGRVIAGPGGDGSHLDYSIKDAEGNWLPVEYPYNYMKGLQRVGT